MLCDIILIRKWVIEVSAPISNGVATKANRLGVLLLPNDPRARNCGVKGGPM